MVMKRVVALGVVGAAVVSGCTIERATGELTTELLTLQEWTAIAERLDSTTAGRNQP